MMISLNLPSDYEIKLEQIAHNENITVSEVIKKAVELYFNVCKKSDRPADYQTLMKELSYAEAGRSFSRDELNERQIFS